MARPKAFDREAVLARALDVFWAKGYAATSLADLLAATRLSKSSLYDTFGSKRALFLAALDLYGRRLERDLVAGLEGDRPATEAIAATLRSAVLRATEAGDLRGCLFGNAAVELAPHDAEVADRVAAGLGRIEQAFYMAVLRGQVAGEIPADRPARTLARLLAAGLQGLHVLARARPRRRALEDAVQGLLAALK